MTEESGSRAATGWEESGRRAAPMINNYFAVAVVSSDPVAAAEVALGMARGEASHRRVVIGDLVGDLAPLAQLVPGDDPHGISDSFLYGISLNSIGRAVPGEKNLVVMLSGTEPVFDEEIIANRRWERLAAGFGEVGALLLLVAQHDTPGLGVLLDHLNGVVLVKDSELPAAPSALVLARVEAPARLTVQRQAPEPLAETDPKPKPRNARRLIWAGAAAVAVLAGVTVATVRILSARHPARPAAAQGANAPLVAAAETLFVAPPANPEDALSAAAFSVEVVAANTAEAANLELHRRGTSLPSATVTPVPIGAERATWYKLIAGAYSDRRQADSLLTALRAAKMLDDSSGSVIHAPLALLVDSLPSQSGINAELKKTIDSYSTRGINTYALIQRDGGARIYSGAFERTEQAGGLIKILRASGLNPLLVYRTGQAP
ncbi:MAG: hypothetical protein M3Z17_11170 [Gemmatimonadota bacterium]|nr:hypothetical protein [Gemmatimonadota bacterium]